jgi:hypothetical protein
VSGSASELVAVDAVTERGRRVTSERVHVAAESAVV